MFISVPFDLTNCRRFFAEPATPRQRQYEALRAFFMEGLASAEVARRFGYSPAAFRMLCYDFRRGELPDFFALTRPGPMSQLPTTKSGCASIGGHICLSYSPQDSSKNPPLSRGGTACLFAWSNKLGNSTVSG